MYCQLDHSDGNVCLTRLTAAGACPNAGDHAVRGYVTLPFVSMAAAGSRP